MMKNRMLAAILLAVLTSTTPVAAEKTYTLVTDSDIGAPVRHGLDKVAAALEKHGLSIRWGNSLEAASGDFTIVTGLASGKGAAAKLHEAWGIRRPAKAESLRIKRLRHSGKEVLLISGADDRGLMYALLDVADRIGWVDPPDSPLSEVREIAESPATSERALAIYTMHQGCFESRFYDEEYWTRYLDMLAENRYNTFALLFGYENAGYFAPPYPHFFDVEEVPQVNVLGMTPEKQKRNVEALKRLIQMTHDRGMNFTVGIWDHVYRGGVQGPKERAENPTQGVVWGLDNENLTSYTQAALTRFIKLFPDLDAIQFRMHGESGLKKGEMGGFWETVYGVMKEHGSHLRFDARAKNFPDELIYKALDMGIDMRICTKYWMEQMPLPYHPAHVNPKNQSGRRHGYADMLRYPKRYDMHWRLWNGGTTRVLLWGDPEYVRRFAESTHLYDGEGFEVLEPMGTKMQDSPHEWPPFELLNKPYRYYDWEFERYWHFYQVFGRVGYNPDTPTEVWEKEFERRFGKRAGPYVQKALHTASQILPMLNTYTFPYDKFPTTRGWAAKQRWKDLPEYAAALPSDTQIFQSIDEAAQFQIKGEVSAKQHPLTSGAWLHQVSQEVLELVDKAERKIGKQENKEFTSTVADLRILANLAEYHSRRVRAGLAWALFKHSEDLNMLDDAILYESKAIEAWKQVVDAAGDIYTDNMMMGRESVGLTGHWKDELVELERGLAELETELENLEASLKKPEFLVHAPIRKAPAGRGLLVRATLRSAEKNSAILKYAIGAGKWKSVEMKSAGPYRFSAKIPGSAVKEGLRYFIQISENASHSPLPVTVTRDDTPPSLAHTAVASAPMGKPLKVTAKVTDPSGVDWVRLRYRNVNQEQDYSTLAMLPTGKPNVYETTVPAEATATEWDLMYLFEVMDKTGNGKIYPDFKNETPYVIVHIQR